MKLKKTKTRLILEQVEILEAGSEGNCIAKIDDLVVFVPFVVPGDVVDLEVYRKKKNFAQAKAVKFTSIRHSGWNRCANISPFAAVANGRR